MRPCCSLHAGPDLLLDNASARTAGNCASITTTTVDDNFRSSQASLPPLDWDEQGETEDLVSLSNLPLDDEDDGAAAARDVETEQLISEIEQLTSRALQETNQWNKQAAGTAAAAAEEGEVAVATTGTAAAEMVNNNNNLLWTPAEDNA